MVDRMPQGPTPPPLNAPLKLPQTPPDVFGIYGKGWRVAKVPSEKLVTNPAWAATIDQFYVHRPDVHPWWHSYVMTVIHLRDIPGTQPPTKGFPEATHELTVMALDPRFPFPSPNESGAYRHLTPININVHVQLTTKDPDASAARLLELTAKAVVTGTLNPDTDGRAAWGPVVRGTVKHMNEGVHD
jgi:hypothetical protein